MTAIIEVSDLSFFYPGICALNEVSFNIEAGTVTALVGPNGAGKTTLLSCIAALEKPFDGRIRLNGIDVIENPRESHRFLGYLPDFFGLYDELTIERCLRYVAMAQGIEDAFVRSAVDRALSRVQLTDRAYQLAGNLSRGLRQRLAIAQAIIHEPKVLILDEPASGLDPEARIHLSALLRDLQAQGMTIIVSSHILAELNDYSTNMMVLREGRLVEHREIAAHMHSTRRRLRISLLRDFPAINSLLSGIDTVTAVTQHDLDVELDFIGETDAQHQLLKHLIENNVPLHSFGPVTQSLQQAYLSTYSEAKPLDANNTRYEDGKRERL